MELLISACLHKTRVGYNAETRRKHSGKGSDIFISEVWNEELSKPEDFELQKE